MPQFPHLQSEDNNRALCKRKGCGELSAGSSGPRGCFLTILDSVGFVWAPEKIWVQSVVQSGNI